MSGTYRRIGTVVGAPAPSVDGRPRGPDPSGLGILGDTGTLLSPAGATMHVFDVILTAVLFLLALNHGAFAGPPHAERTGATRATRGSNS